MAKTTHLHAADVTTVNGVVTARIIGPAVEQHRGAAILETVQRAIDAANPLRGLVLDLGDVTFINSSGIGALIQLRNGVNEHGIPTIAYRTNVEVCTIFVNSKLDKMFEFIETPGELETALAAS